MGAKALFPLAALLSVVIGMMLPVPGADRPDLNARGHYEMMDVGN
jgi:hypothetical protein